MSTTSYEPSENEHGDQPLNVADYPDIHRFTFGQMRNLTSHLVEYPALSREDAVRDWYSENGRVQEVRKFRNRLKNWNVRTLYAALYKKHISRIILHRDPSATSGSAPYMRHYQWGVTMGLSQLSTEDLDELKSTAEEYNRTGTPPELRQSNARQAFLDVTRDYCMTASRHFGYRTFVFYVPESADDGGPGVFDPSLDLGAKKPLDSALDKTLVMDKLVEFERAKVQREELPYFQNLIQAAEAALGDDPELEPSWTAISQSNQEWFADEYLPSILDECKKKSKYIFEIRPKSFPGKQSRIRRGKRNHRTKRGRLAPQFPESEDPLPGKSVSNSSHSQEVAPGTSALPSSSESILGTPASEPWTSEEFVQGTLRSPSPESSELIPRSFGIRSRDRTPDSQQPIPTQPYSASTALARVDHIHTAADIH
ncbi:hypothetical protein BC826DRAFT_974757 [Russula brevipes]|nr:hypothetical protein BC826DRAFT_974757 [Russula brevipes]